MIAAYGLLPVVIVTALACGTLIALMVSIREPLAQRLGGDEAGARWLLRGFHLALVLVFPVAGLFIDNTGVEHGVIAGSVLAAFGIALLALQEGLATTVASLLLCAAGTASLLTATTVLLPYTFYPGNPAAAVNLGYVVISLGWIYMPLLSELLLRGMHLRRSLLLVALACLAPAAVASLTPIDLYPAYQHGDLSAVFQAPLVWLAGVGCLLYLPVEGAVVSWATNRLPGLGYTARRVAWILAGFWVAFLLGRVVTAVVVLGPIVPPGKEPWLLLLLALCVAVGIGNLAGAGPRANVAVGMGLIGFACGPIYPTLVGSVLRRLPQEPATAFGILSALGALGSALLLPLIHRNTRHGSPGRALVIPLVATLLVSALALVWGLALM